MTQSRAGNFDLMRLAASFTVLWSHQYVFMGLPEPGVTYVGSLGGVGVFVFFAISGYLNIKPRALGIASGISDASRAADFSGTHRLRCGLRGARGDRDARQPV
jgi:hypothetical protein